MFLRTNRGKAVGRSIDLVEIPSSCDPRQGLDPRTERVDEQRLARDGRILKSGDDPDDTVAAVL